MLGSRMGRNALIHIASPVLTEPSSLVHEQKDRVPVLVNSVYYNKNTTDNKHLFLTFLEAGKSKINVVADLMSGENPFPGL